MGLASRLRVLMLAGSVLLTAGCAGLPALDGRIETAAVVDTDDTQLGRAVARLAVYHPGKTGIHPLAAPSDAFAARVLLARAAEKSLDVQYYIWRGDQAGQLLFDELWQAAGRGVRVRLLLDDHNTAGLDQTIAALDAHPNIEVRLYNPLAYRGLRALNYLSDFTRVNRRMHNKSFTADNQATIVGGRNIGNEYAGAGRALLFEDLDVIALGPVVREVSRVFDLYWNSPSAYPASHLLQAAEADAAAWLDAKFAANKVDPESIAYTGTLVETPLVRDLLAGKLALEWTDARLLWDDPAKTLAAVERADLLEDLLHTVGRPRQSFDLVSPYFVPGKKGTADLSALAQNGVAVRVLTNSLAASDVRAVHAGYAKRRRALLEAGVQLYEFKPLAPGDEPAMRSRRGGSSSASLHAKTFALDRERIFVGSFNFDPRSALLNTEMGLMIDSPALARLLTTAFDTGIPETAYEVRLAASGSLEWIERTPAGEVRHDVEPRTGIGQRMWIWFLSLLPIEWLL